MTQDFRQSGTATAARPAHREQPGKNLGHYCSTHIWDHQCEANPTVCRAFCGFDFEGDTTWDDVNPECVVCREMLESRGDLDLP